MEQRTIAIELDSEALLHNVKCLHAMATLIEDRSEGIPDEVPSPREHPSPMFLGVALHTTLLAFVNMKIYTNEDMLRILSGVLHNFKQPPPPEGPKMDKQNHPAP